MQQKTIEQHIGFDVHKKFVYGVIKDTDGNLIYHRKFTTEPHDMDLFLAYVKKSISIIAIESCSCWQYVYDYLVDAGYNVVLAHPAGVSALKKLRKHTDRNDAELLADLLRTNMLPLSYAPPWDIRVKRQITRHRHSLTNLQNKAMNRVHAILLRHGIKNLPYSDAFCKKGLIYLESLDLPMCDRLELDDYIEIIRMFEKKRVSSSEYIEKLGSDDPHVRLIMTMPGMGYHNSTTFIGEVGDIRRFESKEKLASFVGVTPRVHQSGEKTKLGSITKQGNRNLRHVMIQAANVAVMHDKTLKKKYIMLAQKKGHQKAIVAIARKMVTLLYTMLKHNNKYHALQIHKAT